MQIVYTFDLPRDNVVFKAHTNAIHFVALLDTIESILNNPGFPDEKVFAIQRAMKGWNL